MQGMDRRRFLKAGATTAAAYGLLGAVAPFERLAAAATPSALPEIQYDVGAFLGNVVFLGPDGQALPESEGGVGFRFGPVHTAFFSIRLARGAKLGRRDRTAWASALDTIESHYPFSPSGLFTTVAYGLPYFRRLPAALVDQHMPRLLDDGSRWAFEEAVAAPTDIAPGAAFPDKRFQVPVRITDFDLLLTMRSDRLENLLDVTRWLTGSGRLRGKAVRSPQLSRLVAAAEPRLMVAQRGFPRRLAGQLRLPYADLIHERSPMWMGFGDQQADAGGPAEITTFAGNAERRLTTATPGDYFGRAGVQHASQVTLDLESWYAEPYEERVGYMFRQVPAQARPTDPAGMRGPAFLRNHFVDAQDAERNAAETQKAEGHGEMGHTTALHRSARTASGTPLHIRLDGPGYDALDLPRGTGPRPKLQFSVFVPTSEQFRTMRRHGSSPDLAAKHAIPLRSNGLEGFTTTTRRQNFLVPPRAHRAFPLAELV
jgi:hypothetical protein